MKEANETGCYRNVFIFVNYSLSLKKTLVGVAFIDYALIVMICSTVYHKVWHYTGSASSLVSEM